MLKMKASQMYKYAITCVLYSLYTKTKNERIQNLLVIVYKMNLGFCLFLIYDKGIICHSEGNKIKKMIGIKWFLRLELCIYIIISDMLSWCI